VADLANGRRKRGRRERRWKFIAANDGGTERAVVGNVRRKNDRVFCFNDEKDVCVGVGATLCR